MKILEIIPQLGSGGAERFTVDLCNELVQIGHDVILLLYFPLNNPEYTFYLHELNPAVKVISIDKKTGFDISIYWKVLKIIQRINPDIIHSHVRAIFYLPIAILKLHSKLKFFHTVHNDAAKEALGSKLDVWIRRFSFTKGYVKPITISPASQKSFEEYYGISAPMIYNGRNIPQKLRLSDVEDFFKDIRNTSDTKVIINIAHIDSVKRQNILAQAVTALNKDGYDIKLILLGRTVEREILNKIIQLNNPNIYVLGAKTNPLEYLKLSDIFCLCSEYEGMPMTLIEALGVGTIPICTPVGGIVNVIKNNENGFLCADLSKEALIDTIKECLRKTPDEITKIKGEISKTYSVYTMTECAQKYLAIFSK